jgi:hypothetical protein
MRKNLKAARKSRLLFLIILTAFCTAISSYGQENKEDAPYERLLRIEIPAKSDAETYRLIPFGEKGVILFYKSLETVDQDKIKWYYSFYDKDLQLIWTRSVGLPGSLEFKQYSVDQDNVAMIFLTAEKAKNVQPGFEILLLSLSNIEFTVNIGIMPPGCEVADLLLKNKKAFIGFNLKNEPALVFFFDLVTGDQKKVQLSDAVSSVLMELTTDTSGTAIYTSSRSPSLKNKPEFFISVFDTSGSLLFRDTIYSLKPGFELNSMRLLAFSPSEIIAAGTYGYPQTQRATSRNAYVPESTGYFFTRIHENRQQEIFMYNFLEFKNIGMMVDDKDIQSIKRKSEKKNKDLQEYSVDLTLLLHSLKMSGNEVIVMSESFTPQYHSENFTDYDFYGRPFTNTYTVFDGYLFGRSILSSFDITGKLLWDNSAEIRNLVAFELNSKVIQFEQGSNRVISYLTDGKIASKIIRGNDVVEKLDFSPVEMNYPNDKLLSETRSRIIPWYGNFFLCCGYQEIKNVSLDKNNKRLVFYFNKIKFE